jgi:hypothetical protein
MASELTPTGPARDAHEPYIRACVEAIEVKGVPVSGWCANADDNRNAGIDLGDGAIQLAWEEQFGWLWGEAVPGEVMLRAPSYLGTDILPEPADVARWAQSIVRGKRPGKSQPQLRYRNWEDCDDGFEARLAAYRTPV